MSRSVKLLGFFCGIGILAQSSQAAPITMNWSQVGNPGNAADTAVMQQDGTTGYGAVNYVYNIGTYDVTNSQYAQFLNSVDPTGANKLRLFEVNMNGVSINRVATNPVGSIYSVIPADANHPVSYVNWYSAIRFVNWLDNGQGEGSTETGAYTLLGDTPFPSNATAIVRSPGAKVFLPSENEWYKAAYYNPATNSYFIYPTSSNTAPTKTPPTSIPNSANFENVAGSLTDVGAYTGTTSPIGAFDMAGNVFQWNESLLDNDQARGLRGGSISDTFTTDSSSSFRYNEDPTYVAYGVGFRVASLPSAGVPEPSAFLLAGLGALGLAVAQRRARGHALSRHRSPCPPRPRDLRSNRVKRSGDHFTAGG